MKQPINQNKMEGKQTAVDFLFEMWLQDKTITKEALEQAMEIQRKHLYHFYIQGGIDLYLEADRTVGDFYNEEFKP
jgi:hypothetical protein